MVRQSNAVARDRVPDRIWIMTIRVGVFLAMFLAGGVSAADRSGDESDRRGSVSHFGNYPPIEFAVVMGETL
ncbi:MAG: hypothetical protein ACI91J_001000 [Yoonia sp.]|jgi:hypothetical protein